MGFFNKMFGDTVTAAKAVTEPRGVDCIAALAMQLRGDTDGALSAFLKIGAELPDDTLAPFFAATIKAARGDSGEAAEMLRELSRRIALGGKTISREIAEKLVALLRREPHLTTPAVAEIVVTCGDRLKNEGFVQESAVCFEIATGLVPDHAQVLHKLGDTLHDLRIYDYAETVLLRALKFAPNHWGAIYTYAVLLQDLGRFTEALPYYEKAVALNPDHVKCQNNYGAALMMTDRLQEALVHCQVAAELDPEFSSAKVNLGNIYLHMHKYETARTCFAEAIKLDENLAAAYFGLGSVEQLLGSDSGLVRELYLKAVKLNPAIPELHQALGKLLAAEGNPAALAYFAEAARLDTTLQSLHFDFGNACLKLGRQEEALEHLRIALQQNPDDALAREILSKVEE